MKEAGNNYVKLKQTKQEPQLLAEVASKTLRKNFTFTCYC